MSSSEKNRTKLQRFFELTKKAGRVFFHEGPAGLAKKSRIFFSSHKSAPAAAGKNEEGMFLTPETSNKENHGIQHAFDQIILVYQMGRVGSKSIENFLRNYYPSSSRCLVLHGHYLNEFAELEKRVKTDLVDISGFMTDLKNVNDVFRKAIADNPPGRKIKIISLVRDPVARNVSTFFYAIEQFIPDWEARYSNGLLSLDDLVAIFISKRSFVLTALHWFDEQMAPVFGIDVFADPFPREKGYMIYSAEKADLLLIRTENLNQCAPEAFRKFLGIENFEMLKMNTGEESKAGNLYRLFTKKSLPLEYVQWTYRFKLPRHFYTDAELDAFRRRWTG